MPALSRSPRGRYVSMSVPEIYKYGKTNYLLSCAYYPISASIEWRRSWNKKQDLRKFQEQSRNVLNCTIQRKLSFKYQNTTEVFIKMTRFHFLQGFCFVFCTLRCLRTWKALDAFLPNIWLISPKELCVRYNLSRVDQLN